MIEKQEDNYATDILAQKVIYFMSLWSEDMLAHLEKLRDKGILKGKADGDKIDEEDFLIQMDEVD